MAKHAVFCDYGSQDCHVQSDSGSEIGFYDSQGSSTGKSMDRSQGELAVKVDDPLSEPIVRLSLEKARITGSQLINMSVKELNRRLASCPNFLVSKLKRCRRTLKNRGYARNCRIKRIAAKNQLEQVNTKLMRENRELRQRNRSLLDQLNRMSSDCTQVTNQHQHHQHLPSGSMCTTSGPQLIYAATTSNNSNNSINHQVPIIYGAGDRRECISDPQYDLSGAIRPPPYSTTDDHTDYRQFEVEFECLVGDVVETSTVPDAPFCNHDWAAPTMN